MADFLLEAGVQIAIRSLILAALWGDRAMVEQIAMVEQMMPTGNYLNARSRNDEFSYFSTRIVTPLVAAASNQEWECTKTIISHGATVDEHVLLFVQPLEFVKLANLESYQLVVWRFSSITNVKGNALEKPNGESLAPGVLRFDVKPKRDRTRVVLQGEFQGQVWVIDSYRGFYAPISMRRDLYDYDIKFWSDTSKPATPVLSFSEWYADWLDVAQRDIPPRY